MNETTTVTLTLDGQPHQMTAGSTLATLVDALGHVRTKVSTAVNGMFVPCGQRAQCVLRDGDAVLLFQPIVGG
jgi:sulfur carrier protein